MNMQTRGTRPGGQQRSRRRSCSALKDPRRLIMPIEQHLADTNIREVFGTTAIPTARLHHHRPIWSRRVRHRSRRRGVLCAETLAKNHMRRRRAAPPRRPGLARPVQRTFRNCCVLIRAARRCFEPAFAWRCRDPGQPALPFVYERTPRLKAGQIIESRLRRRALSFYIWAGTGRDLSSRFAGDVQTRRFRPEAEGCCRRDRSARFTLRSAVARCRRRPRCGCGGVRSQPRAPGSPGGEVIALLRPSRRPADSTSRRARGAGESVNPHVSGHASRHARTPAARSPYLGPAQQGKQRVSHAHGHLHHCRILRRIRSIQPMSSTSGRVVAETPVTDPEPSR